MAAGGGTKAVLAAMIGNALIAVAKFAGFLLTRSSSMLSEAIHSVADSGNQALLLLGGKQAQKEPTSTHQFGYGRERYFWSFVVALVLFALGSAFAIYHGIEQVLHALDHPEEEPEDFLIAVIILVVAIVIESFTFRVAIRESKAVKGNLGWWQFIKRARTPELPVVLLEDLGALIGLVLALFAVGMSALTENPVWDGVGSIVIGILLGVIAIILILEMRSMLLGESADSVDMDKLRAIVASSDIAEDLIHLRTQFIGPDQLLIAAKIAVTPTQSMQDIATGINSLEAKIRSAIPYANPVYIEPDIMAAKEA